MRDLNQCKQVHAGYVRTKDNILGSNSRDNYESEKLHTRVSNSQWLRNWQ
jgi:hypothetical protein